MNTYFHAIAQMALRVQKENQKLKQEKKTLQEKIARFEDHNRYRYMINGS